MRVQYRCLPHWATIDRLTMYSDVTSISPPRLLLQDKSLIRRKKMLLSSPSSSLIFYSLLLFPTQRWSLCTATKPNPQCLLSALSPTYALSISPSPVAIIHQIRNGVEKTARRIVDPLNTRGGRDGGGMYRRHRQLHVGSLGCSILVLFDQAKVFGYSNGADVANTI